ncbi:MAG TPA: hypothetical protein VGO80_02660 [Solirubrobacteraceae bacterium]|jgi:hypothetical protein|nr:hypothetical protein [Solirubrobacteraceae bacterium]
MSRHLRTCAVLLAIAVPLALASCGGSDPKPSRTTTGATATNAGGPKIGPAFGSMDALPGVLKTPPPWPANADELQLRLRAIGLPALTEEGQVVHIHQHLDLFVDGESVPVASDIGIAADRSFISPLHTHAPQDGQPPNGILHVESPTQAIFSLGQFFAVWGVRLDADCIGGRCADEDGRELHTWVDGKPVAGDPTRIVLAEHQEIVLAYGTPEQMPKKVPSSYDFEAVGL